VKRNLTDRLLRSMAKSGEPPETWDQILRGFGARARVGGATFFAMRRVRGAGRPQAARITVGEYGPLTLAEARERARLILRDLQDGIDPRERKAEQLRTEMAKQSNSSAGMSSRRGPPAISSFGFGANWSHAGAVARSLRSRART
jgi:hypothetical protein